MSGPLPTPSPKDANGFFLKPRLDILSNAAPVIRETWDYLLSAARFKDGDHDGLKAGQIRVTIDGLRKALSWDMGARIESYTRRKCENAILFLVKNGLISKDSGSGRSGIVITVREYGQFQTANAYKSANVVSGVVLDSSGCGFENVEKDNNNDALFEDPEPRMWFSEPPGVVSGVVLPDSTIIRERTKNERFENLSSLPKQKSKKSQKCPQSEIIDLYNKILPELPEIRFWGDTSKKNLRARWNSSIDFQNLDFWEQLFERIRSSDFLMGQKTDFIANLSWIVKPQNFEKILNGNYDNRSAPIIKKTTAFEERNKAAIIGFHRIMEERKRKNGND